MKSRHVNKSLVVFVAILVTILCLVGAFVLTQASRKQIEKKEINIRLTQTKSYLNDKFAYLQTLDTPKAVVGQASVISDNCHWGHYSIPFDGPIPFFPSGDLQTPNNVTCFATLSASFLYDMPICEAYNQLISHKALVGSSYYFTGIGSCNDTGQFKPAVDYSDTKPFPNSTTAIKLTKISTGSYSTKLTMNIRVRYYNK